MKKLTIVQMNDLHGYLEPHTELFWQGDRAVFRKAGGLARISTMLKNIRKKHGEILFLDGGDTIHGTYHTVKTKGKILIPFLNKLEIDAMTSHWEFAYGPKNYLELMNDLNFPSLAVNCYYEGSNELVFPPYIIKEVSGLHVGIIGIASPIVDKVMPEHFSEGVYFTIGEKEVREYVSKLKEENLDLIVIISHLGYPQDLKIAKNVNGIDILLSAHTHNRIYSPARINNTLIIQSGCHGSFLGKIDLEVSNKKIVAYQHELIEISANIESDPEIEQMLQEVLKDDTDFLEQKIGRTDIPLHRYGALEATMDNLLLDSMIDLTGAELAFSNGWRYGAPIEPGVITMNDLYNIIPVNPFISTTDISGRDVWKMMEENLERTFSRNPYQQMGGYVKRSSGLQMYFKVENPAGERIQELFIKNKPIEMDKIYKSVFVTMQGVPSKYGENRIQTDVRAIANLKDYIQRTRIVNPELKKHIVLV